ncbi:MAG: cellulase family glycosylhydrolase, partial [Asticcacaulis sp.]|nr:cellulase family glycosylhydrolase [Asticcacaulis sp.]
MMFHKRLHYRVVLLAALALSVAACGGGGGGSSASTPPPPPPPPSNLSAVTTAELGRGWNLGNTLEASNGSSVPPTTSQETYWGNPAVNQQLMNEVAAAGFKSVRIPVDWIEYMDASGNVPPFWLT